MVTSFTCEKGSVSGSDYKVNIKLAPPPLLKVCIDREHGLQVFGDMGNTFVTWYEYPKFMKKEDFHAVEGVFGNVAETRVGYVCIR